MIVDVVLLLGNCVTSWQAYAFLPADTGKALRRTELQEAGDYGELSDIAGLLQATAIPLGGTVVDVGSGEQDNGVVIVPAPMGVRVDCM